MLPFIQDFSVKHDGRVLRLELYINTDEDEREVLARTVKAARGQVRNAVMSSCSVYTGGTGTQIWQAVQQAHVKTQQDPNVQHVDENLQPKDKQP